MLVISKMKSNYFLSLVVRKVAKKIMGKKGWNEDEMLANELNIFAAVFV